VALLLSTGDLTVDEAVEEHGHLPNDDFWTGVAEYLISNYRPDLSDVFEFDSEAGTFAAYGDRDQLLALADLMRPAVTDPDAIGALITAATAAGYEFDD
jgi:hypothetical protein